MTKNLMRRVALFAVPAVIVAGAGTAIAANGGGNTIRACVNKNGAVKIVDGTRKCGSKETLLTWNQTGPAGAQGAQGAQGPQGPAGAGGTVESNIVGGDPLDGGQAVGLALLDGVSGDAAGGALDVKAFRFGGKNTVASGGGGGAGKVAFDDVRFQKLYDSSSPTLMLRMASGQHIASVTFTFRRPGTNGATFLTYKLSDVVVTSYLQGGGKERPLLENVELNFARVEITFQPATGAPVKTGWDVKTNQSA